MAKMLDQFSRQMRGEIPPTPVTTLGFTLTAIQAGEAIFEFEATERHANPVGTVLGGIICALADAAMGWAYLSELDEDSRAAMLDLKINFLKPVRTGRLRAMGKVISRGRTITLVECDVTNDQEELVARASCTCMALRDERPAGSGG